jgi:hypothetical protein
MLRADGGYGRPYVRAVKVARLGTKQETGVAPDGPEPSPMVERLRKSKHHRQIARLNIRRDKCPILIGNARLGAHPAGFH